MTVTEPVTQVRSTADDRLVARCVACDVDLEQRAGADVCAALDAFDRCHPGTTDRPHDASLPAGWQPPQPAGREDTAPP
jgi:hypothetical protein